MNFFGNNNISSDNNNSLLDQFPKKRNLQRCIQVFSGLALGAASSVALGLGLGDMESKSFLGQPLAANIELISLDGEIDPDTLIVRQVTRIEAEKMGVDIFQSGYRFDMNVDYSTGRPIVTVVSKKSIDEPYLNLLVELRWASGVVYREYPILLDPPPLVPVSSVEAKEVAKRPISTQRTSRPATSKASQASNRPVPSNTASGSNSLDGAGSGESYKVQSGDNLWQIAKRLSSGTNFSINETMTWVHENNPGAFSNGDKNRLKAGARLTMPDMSSLELEEKLNTVPARALSDSDASAPLQPVSAQETNNELEIEEMTSFNDLEQPEQGLLVVNSEQSEDQSRELIDMLTRENEDLKERMSKVENSEYLDTLKKLVALQKRQISELRATLGVRDTSSEEMSALLEKADVDIDSLVDTAGAADVESELASIEEGLEESLEVTAEEPQPVEEAAQATAASDEASLVDLEPPLANPPEARADKSLVTWLVVGAGAFLAMIFAFLLIYYRKMVPNKSEDDYDDDEFESSHSRSFFSSSESSEDTPQERAPDIGYEGENDLPEADEDGDWLGEKVDDVDAFDAGAFDNAIQEVEEIFESISLDENALDELEDVESGESPTQIKGRSEDEVRSSIAEKMSQYNPTDFRTGGVNLGLLEIDEDSGDEQVESDETDATINRAKMFCEFSQFDRARELIEKSMGELPDDRFTAALQYIAEKKSSAEEQGEDETQVEGFNASLDENSEMLEEAFVGDFSEDTLGSDDSSEIESIKPVEGATADSAAVLMDKFEGDLEDDLGEDSTEFSDSFNLDEDATEVLAVNDSVADASEEESGLDLDLDLDVDFDEVDFDDDIQIDDGGIEAKKKPVSC